MPTTLVLYTYIICIWVGSFIFILLLPRDDDCITCIYIYIYKATRTMGQFPSAPPHPPPPTRTVDRLCTYDDERVLRVRRKVISVSRQYIYIGRYKCITYEVYCELLLVFIRLKTMCKNSADAIQSLQIIIICVHCDVYTVCLP